MFRKGDEMGCFMLGLIVVMFFLKVMMDFNLVWFLCCLICMGEMMGSGFVKV